MRRTATAKMIGVVSDPRGGQFFAAVDQLKVPQDLPRILAIAESFELSHDDLKAANTRQAPDEVSPVEHPACDISAAGLTATLKPLSWNVFALKPH